MDDLTLAPDITRPTGSRRVLARLETLQASSVFLLGVAERSLFKDAESPDALIWTRRVHTLLEKIGQELESAIRDGRTALIAIALIASVATLACGSTHRPPRPPFDAAAAGHLCETVWQTELGRGIDPTGLTGCLTAVRTGQTRDQIAAGVHGSPEAQAYRTRPATPPPPVPVVIHGDEEGSLIRDGQHLRDGRGIWRARGFSDFMLFKRFLDGQDIGPLLDERIALGANVLRVLGMAEHIARFHPQDYGNRYWTGLDAFLSLIEARRVRVEFVVFADAQFIIPRTEDQRAHLRAVVDAFTNHFNRVADRQTPAPAALLAWRGSPRAGRVLASQGRSDGHHVAGALLPLSPDRVRAPARVDSKTALAGVSPLRQPDVCESAPHLRGHSNGQQSRSSDQGAIGHEGERELARRRPAPATHGLQTWSSIDRSQYLYRSARLSSWRSGSNLRAVYARAATRTKATAGCAVYAAQSVQVWPSPRPAAVRTTGVSRLRSTTEAALANSSQTSEGRLTHLIELVNEFAQNGVDPLQFEKPIGPFLISRGSGLADADPVRPAWDYINDHPGRNSEWLRRLHCREFMDSDRTGCIEGEPMGASETDQPGRRSASVDDFGQFGVGCALLTDGCTFHSDAGIQSEPLGPVQRACAERFFAGLRWPPADAVTWAYQRGDMGSEAGIGGMPLKHSDALSLRTFCKTNNGQSWCVAMRPGAAWTAQARDGARVINEPFRGWVALQR